jgi:hypothetical protein
MIMIIRDVLVILLPVIGCMESLCATVLLRHAVHFFSRCASKFRAAAGRVTPAVAEGQALHLAIVMGILLAILPGFIAIGTGGMALCGTA